MRAWPTLPSAHASPFAGGSETGEALILQQDIIDKIECKFGRFVIAERYA